MSREIDRRAVVAGIAGALPVAAIGAVSAVAASSGDLARLIEDHRAAYQAFCNTLSENGENDDSADYNVANDAEQDALLASLLVSLPVD